jgi:hypothetical protein
MPVNCLRGFFPWLENCPQWGSSQGNLTSIPFVFQPAGKCAEGLNMFSSGNLKNRGQLLLAREQSKQEWSSLFVPISALRGSGERKCWGYSQNSGPAASTLTSPSLKVGTSCSASLDFSPSPQSGLSLLLGRMHHLKWLSTPYYIWRKRGSENQGLSPRWGIIQQVLNPWPFLPLWFRCLQSGSLSEGVTGHKGSFWQWQWKWNPSRERMNISSKV